MRSKRLHLITAVLACWVFLGCKKETEEFTSAPLSDYFPLQVGKYVTYRLDSTVFTNFGTATETHSYQEKQIVDAQITDAQGRESYRILRFIRDTAGIQPWAPTGSYFVTPTTKTIEVIDNNLRFVKLALPIVQDFSWKGNNYLPTDPFEPSYSLKTSGIEFWDYTYSSINDAVTVNGKTYDSVLTVNAADDAKDANRDDFTVTDPNTIIAYVNYLQEQYAKGIGLVAQRFIVWEYQNQSGSPNAGIKAGFGVKRSIIDHN
jgi:hypothetical protein